MLGPTATGKTRLAALLASAINGEIISADSRQVYRGMDIGTGKDYDDYKTGNTSVPYHLIDIAEAGTHYNVYQFRRDFANALREITGRDKMPVLCGGTGLYIEAVLKDYDLNTTPPDDKLRKELETIATTELTAILASMSITLNDSDAHNRRRLIRAIEKEISEKGVSWQEAANGTVTPPKADHHSLVTSYLSPVTAPQVDHQSPIQSIIFGIDPGREIRRNRITERLRSRLENGMIEEVKSLLQSGLSPEQLIYYGLEYRYITLFVTGRINYNEMFTQLETAIHRFAKRQMTWFRRMENRGMKIHWIDGNLTEEVKLMKINEILSLDI